MSHKRVKIPMKLNYSGKHLKTYRIVDRANQLLISPFFKAEVDNLLTAYYRSEISDNFKTILETDRLVSVKTFFNPFSRKKILSRSNAIYVNSLRIEKSHRDALVSLMHGVLQKADENDVVSNTLGLENKQQKENFFKEFAAISKNYM